MSEEEKDIIHLDKALKEVSNMTAISDSMKVRMKSFLIQNDSEEKIKKVKSDFCASLWQFGNYVPLDEAIEKLMMYRQVSKEAILKEFNELQNSTVNRVYLSLWVYHGDREFFVHMEGYSNKGVRIWNVAIDKDGKYLHSLNP